MSAANGEIDQYAKELRKLFGRLCKSVEGLSDEQLNWRPPAAQTNSIFAIATHTLGNARAWILGICCGAPIDRDRPAEFRASGKEASPIVAGAHGLLAEIEPALRKLPVESLDELREPRQQLWGAGTVEPVTGREAILHVVEHFATHLGQIEVTRDLAVSQAKS
jgi:uncharacterized damage-inducible protein DinB